MQMDILQRAPQLGQKNLLTETVQTADALDEEYDRLIAIYTEVLPSPPSSRTPISSRVAILPLRAPLLTALTRRE